MHGIADLVILDSKVWCSPARTVQRLRRVQPRQHKEDREGASWQKELLTAAPGKPENRSQGLESLERASLYTAFDLEVFANYTCSSGEQRNPE
mmetsp:Transcript_22559/g.40730  ORF Transcript_22559/g.40730 Transcript_22559/m.40730 type:complete len:93 (+) Transcript_22559:490-768(+)